MKKRKTFHWEISAVVLFFLLLGVAGACSDSDSSFSNEMSGSGTGGSMARFSIQGDYLYTVDNNNLKVFDISRPAQPRHLVSKDQWLTMGAETIFVLHDRLFIGSQNGMYIYNIGNDPERPHLLSMVSHIKSCDPVVAQGNYAYVTLNSASSWCGRTSNLLQVYDITDPTAPELVKEMTAPLSSPMGLGVDGNKLFICDRGVKVFDITDPTHPVWVDDFDHIDPLRLVNTYDLIPLDGLLLVVGSDGLYQVDYSGSKLEFVSKIEVKRTL